VKHRVGPGIEIRRALSQKRQRIKKPLPKKRHGKHSMRRITVQEKGLAKGGQIPMNGEEN